MRSSRVAVVGDDVLTLAVARHLAGSLAGVVVHPPPGTTEVAHRFTHLRLLDQDAQRVARERHALDLWRALEHETGVRVTAPSHAVDVGPESTVAAVLHAGHPDLPARALSPVEATREWPSIRFAGAVALQPAAVRIDVARAREALLRAAAGRGVLIGAPASRVRRVASGDVEVATDAARHRYDATIVVADPAARTALAGRPGAVRQGTVLTVDTIGPIRHWPSVRHHRGLPADFDGYLLGGAQADFAGERVRLALTGGPVAPDEAAARLWEYAARWLPGTIVGTARVRTEDQAPARLDTSLGRLAVTSPLGSGQRELAPLVAAELARQLLQSIAIDYETEHAS